MIDSVQITGNGGFIINDAIFIYNLDYSENGIQYSLKYDENITPEQAKQISDAFIEVSLQNILKKS